MIRRTLLSTSVNEWTCSWGPDVLWLKLCALFLATLLCGCSHLPPPPASRIVPPPHWGEEGHSKGAPSRAAWWTLFRDSELNRLAPKAVDAQPNLLLARGKADEARAHTGAALAHAWPTLQFDPSAGKTRNSSNDEPYGVLRPFFTAAPYDRYLTPLSASYAIDVFGRSRKELCAMRLNECAAEADVAAAQLLITGELGQAYFLVQSLALEHDLLSRTISDRSGQVEIQESLVKAGKANEVALARSRLELAQVRLDEAGIRASQHASLHALAILCGEPPANFKAPALRPLPDPPAIPSGVPADILARRPDLVAARARLEAALSKEEAAQRAFFPTIQLTAAGGYASTDLSKLIRPASLAWSVGAGLSQVVFDGGLRKANVKAARARYEQAVAQYDSTLLTAFREVEDALSRLSFVRVEGTKAEEAEHAAREMADIALARYKDGLSSYDPVIDANHTLLEISRRRIQIQRALCDGTIQLIVALGGCW